MIRTGIVGCRNIAGMHITSLQSLEQVEIKAIADIESERVEKCVRNYQLKNVHRYSTLEEMLEKEELDVLHICTPHYLHVSMAMLALKKGIHVFMEKPPAITRGEFELLCEEQKRQQKEIGICFQNRYNETSREIQRVLSQGILGQVKGARAFVTWNREVPYYKESGWRGTWEKEGGGVLINQSIHTLDLLVQFLGEPEMAESSFCNHHLKGVIDVEDTMEAFIKLGGIPVCFYATTAYCEDAPVRIDVVCEEGCIKMEGNQLLIQQKNGMKQWFDFEKIQKQETGKTYWGNSHCACIQDFYQCLEIGREFGNNLKSVRNIMKLTMGLYDSAKNHKAVEWGKEQL